MADTTNTTNNTWGDFLNRLKGGSLGDFGTDVSVSDSVILKLVGSIVIGVIIIIIMNALIKSLAK